MRNGMKALSGLLLLLTAACAPPAPQTAQRRTSTVTLFTGPRLIVGDGATIENAAFLVQNGLILQIGAAGEVRAPAGAGTVNLAGRTVMPALVNAHSHLGWEGYTSWGSQNMTRENLIDHLHRHAYYGVGTTAGTGSEKEDIALRVQLEQRLGQIGGARYVVVPGIGTPGGGPNPNFTADKGWWGSAGGMHEVSSPDAARKVVQAEAARGVQNLKMWVDARDERRGAKVKLSPEIYRAVLDEAQVHDIRVFTHSTNLEDQKMLIRAGARRLMHYGGIDDEWLALMKERNVFLLAVNGVASGGGIDPSYYKDPFFQEHVSAAVIKRLSDPANLPPIGQRTANPAPVNPAATEAARLQTARNFKRLVDAGIQVTLSADAGFGPTGTLVGTFFGYSEHVQMENFVRLGMTPAQAIVASTSRPAAALGLSDLVGTIAPGKSADFLVLDANPLDDIMNSRRISRVYLRGEEIDRAALRAAWTR
jgi:imidazolonepropionase-like amidohydrolase